MKNIRIIAALALGLCVAFPAAASAAEASPPNLNQVKQELAPLANAFGVETPKPAPQPASQQSPPDSGHKTIGDVADRALDMVQVVTVKLADSLSKVAPKVWEIMLKQQYAKAVSGLVEPLTWLLGIAFFAYAGGKFWKRMPGGTEQGVSSRNPSDADWANLWRAIFFRIVPIVVAFISILNLGFAIKDATLLLVNPEYYAIQDLLRSIMSGGQLQ